MVETQLTSDLINEGATLIRSLDKSGSSPDAALWFYFPDIGSWKLLLVQAKVGSEGPRQAYKVIQKALQSLRGQVSHISLEDVAVAKPDSPLIGLLSKTISTGPDIAGIRFSRSVIDGTPIEDAYIYRLRRAAP